MKMWYNYIMQTKQFMEVRNMAKSICPECGLKEAISIAKEGLKDEKYARAFNTVHSIVVYISYLLM